MSAERPGRSVSTYVIGIATALMVALAAGAVWCVLQLYLRYDLIGINAIHSRPQAVEPDEVRIRVAARCDSMKEAVRIGNEVETLYTNGPAGGGGATKSAREVVAILSVLLPRENVKPLINTLEV